MITIWKVPFVDESFAPNVFVDDLKTEAPISNYTFD